MLSSKMREHMNNQKPVVLKNSEYWRWRITRSSKACIPCLSLDGRMFEWIDTTQQKPPLHLNCKCSAEGVLTILAGTATNKGIDGADWHLKHFNRLPDNYITKKNAKKLGWEKRLGNLSEVAPGKMICGEYYNMKKILPVKEGRRWFEADINYNEGYRNSERLIFSNDGLIFVTYDHGESFYQIR